MIGSTNVMSSSSTIGGGGLEYIKVVNKSVTLEKSASLNISDFSEKGWYLLNVQCSGWGTLEQHSCISMPVYSDSEQLSGCASILFSTNTGLGSVSVRIYNNKIYYQYNAAPFIV